MPIYLDRLLGKRSNKLHKKSVSSLRDFAACYWPTTWHRRIWSQIIRILNHSPGCRHDYNLMTARKMFSNNFCKDIHRWKLSLHCALLLTVCVIIPGIQWLYSTPFRVLYARNTSCNPFNEDTDHAGSSSNVSDLLSEGAWFATIRGHRLL